MSELEPETSPSPEQTPSAFPYRDRASASFRHSLLERPARVCRNCRLGKRKCDKHYPACGRCKRLGLNCSYDDLDINQITTSKGTPASEDSRYASQVMLALPTELHPPGSYPIQERWYMPFLLQQFLQDFGMSRMPVDPKSIAYQMQTVYLRHSLADPCMFHASMYAASSHLDAARNDCDNPITLYHKSETLHHIRQRIAQSQDGIGKGLDEAIASVIPLAFFTYLSGNITESKSHLDGLVHMMATDRGRGSLELRGLLGGLITLSALVFTIVFDHPYLELSTLAWTMWPLRPPILYIHKLVSEVLRAFDEDRLSKLVYDAIHDIYDVTRSFITTSRNWQHRAYITSIYNRWRFERDSYENALDLSSERPKERQDPIYSAVYLTAILFFSILDNSDRSPEKIHVQCKLLEELQVVLQDTKDAMWLEANPFIFSWLCLTCAAASESVHQRAWFYYRQGPVFMALINGPSCIQDALSYYTWLRNLSPALPSRDQLYSQHA